jgi:hypothetical protein
MKPADQIAESSAAAAIRRNQFTARGEQIQVRLRFISVRQAYSLTAKRA